MGVAAVGRREGLHWRRGRQGYDPGGVEEPARACRDRNGERYLHARRRGQRGAVRADARAALCDRRRGGEEPALMGDDDPALSGPRDWWATLTQGCAPQAVLALGFEIEPLRGS